MIEFGPFRAEVWVDDINPDKSVYIHIYHINQHIDTVDTNLSIADSGPDGIPSYLEKETLISWLAAGERDIVSDLEKSGWKPWTEYNVSGYDSRDKVVTSGSNSSARINIDASWQGKRVKVILLDPIDDFIEE